MTAKKPRKKAERHVITLRVSPGVHKKLRYAAVDRNTTIQAILMAGVELALLERDARL